MKNYIVVVVNSLGNFVCLLDCTESAIMRYVHQLGFAEGEDKKIEGYNQAIDDYEKIFQEEEDSIFPEPDNTPVPIQVSARFRPNPNNKSWWTEKEEAACVEISKMRDEREKSV